MNSLAGQLNGGMTAGKKVGVSKVGQS